MVVMQVVRFQFPDVHRFSPRPGPFSWRSDPSAPVMIDTRETQRYR